MLSRTDISIELVASYCLTTYQVGIGASVFTAVYIDQYSEAMLRLLTAKNVSCAAIITAYNPLSQIQSHQKNITEHVALNEILQKYRVSIIESINIDPTGNWPDERSICIFGMSLETARSLGQQFGQNAIVWLGNDAIPRIVLLR